MSPVSCLACLPAFDDVLEGHLTLQARWRALPRRDLAAGTPCAPRRPGDQCLARRAEFGALLLARLTDGEQVLVLREVLRPTRMLHPAVDCYRAMGHRVTDTRLERDAEGRLWRCFVATREGAGAGGGASDRQRVCERIVDAHGQAYTDTSSWYWAAVSGQSTGPWQAVTRAHALP